MKLNAPLFLFSSLILTVSYLTTVQAVTDAELEALEKQIEQLETEEIKKAAAEEETKADTKRKAEQERKAEAEAKRKAKLEKQRLEEAKRLAEKQAEAERIAKIERQRKEALTLAGEMVSIPGGTFQMGYDAAYDEQGHSVTISPFRLGKYEITFAQWTQCVDDGSCDGKRPRAGRGNRPVTRVNWDNAKLYIQWLNQKTGGNFRLPSEAEWEYAVRAGSKTAYHFGDSSSEICRYGNIYDETGKRDLGYDIGNIPCDDGEAKTAQVGSYQPNQFGLHDMYGNAVEWVEDCWNDTYDGAPSDGSAWTSGDCSKRVQRGDSYNGAHPYGFQSNYRHRTKRTYGFEFYGFRLAQDI